MVGVAPSFGNFLAACKGSFPTALMGGHELGRLLSVAERLPLSVIDQRFGFEFDLGSEKPAADFCVVALPGSPLATHFVRDGEAAPRGSPGAALGACLADAADNPGSLLASMDGGVTLEYDVASAGLPDECPPPGLFFTPHGNTIAAARRLLDCPRSVFAGLCAAAGWPFDREELRQIERVYESLPDAALVAQAGVLPGRPQRAVRLVIHRIDPCALADFLERLDWPGSTETALSVIADATDVTQPNAVLSIDVSAAGVAPRLGMELYPAPAADGQEQTNRNNWPPIIDRLEQRGWCLPGKAEGLRAWAHTEKVVGAGAMYQVYRHLNHMKAVVHHGQVTAKAYAAMLARRLNG